MNEVDSIKRKALWIGFAQLFFTAIVSAQSPSMNMTNGTKDSDGIITATIQKKFAADPILAGQNIKVSTQDGNVTLNGDVTTDQQSAAAEKDAKSVPGVKNVESYIVSQTPDCTLTANVTKKITKDDSLKGQDIKVKTEDGVVTLTGTVTTQAQMDTAEKLAKSVPGVKDVKSNIGISNVNAVPSTTK